ncbi:MAG: FAD-binding oxidoreductase, partial [Dehalococcoidia bacterium]
METTTSLTAIEAALPPEAITPGTAAYAVDGAIPSLVLTPASEDEVAAALRAASESDAAVIAMGSRQRLGLGMPPSRYDVALDMTKLNRVIEYSPADLMVRVGAGMLLSDLQRSLGDNGQWLPLDPPGEDGTIGGLLAANRSGPARLVFGSARDLVIGMRTIGPDGEMTKTGGRVVKNVAGYDLAKLHIGAIGTLGVIVEATFKVAPLPAETSTMTFSGSCQSLMSTALLIRNHGLAVTGMTLSAAGGEWRLQARFAGGSAAVSRSRRDAEFLAQRNDVSVADDAPVSFGGVLVARASLPPMSVQQVAESMASMGASVLSYPLTGTVRGYWSAEPPVAQLQALRNLCRLGSGVLVIEDASPSLKQRFDVWGEPGNDLELM